MIARLTPDTRSETSVPSQIDLRLALEAGRFGTWRLVPATLELIASARCKANYGHEPEVPFGFDEWTRAVHPDDFPKTLQALEHSIATAADFDAEYRVILPSGAIRWLNARGRPYLDEATGTLQMTGVCEDVTERRRQDIYRSALVDLSDHIATVADPQELTYTACEILARTLNVSRAGYGLIDPVAETITIERDWNAPGIATLAGVLKFREHGSYIDDLKRGQTVVVADARLDPRTCDTAAVLEAISARAFVNMPVHEEGGMVALLYVNHAHAREWHEDDIAFMRELAVRTRTAEARRRAEQDLRALTDSLEAQVQARTAALMSAEEALRQAQKMEAVGQLTGGVAHDFNNLLTVIRSSVDLLARPNLPEDRRRRYVEAISTTVGRATRLTSQLLAFARRQALRPEVFDVAASVSSIHEMIGTLAGSRISIRTQVPAVACLIHADPNQFDTALVNMAVNARDAMDGEGEMVISMTPVGSIPALRGDPGRKGNFVAVSISDNGAGISADNLERVFEPFFTTKPFGHGTGLGLSQVFGFAKQSGGEVLIRSVLGGGTTVTLYLPRAEGLNPPRVAAPAPATARAGQGLQVLVVEDNPEVGAFAAESLEELGYRAQWVSCAQDALAELSSDPARYSVVFSDVVMPGLSGLQLASTIGERYPHLPVVLASGYSHVLAQEGSSDYALIHKPYSIQELSQALTAAVQTRSDASRDPGEPTAKPR